MPQSAVAGVLAELYAERLASERAALAAAGAASVEEFALRAGPEASFSWLPDEG